MPYRYDTYDNSAYANRIGSLLLRRGEIASRNAETVGEAQARAAEVGGAIRAGAARNIGAVLSGAIGDVIRHREEAPQREMQQLQLQSAREAVGDRARVRAQQTQADHDESAAQIGHEILLNGGTPDAVASAMHRAVKSGALQPDEAEQFTLMSVEHAEKIPDAAKALLARSPTGQALLERMSAPKPKAPLMNVDPTHDIFDPNTGQVVRKGTPKEEKPAAVPVPQPFTLGEGQRRFDASGKLIASVPKSAPAGADDVTQLSAAGLDAAALNYAKTGLLPPLGMGDKNTRKLIINRAAEMMPGLDVASAKADFGANSDSLKALQKQRDALGAFETTALKNLDVFLGAAGKVTDTGSPLFNKPIRTLSDQMFGGDAQTAFNVARRTVIPEFAKILANPGLSGQLSDSARKEIEDVVSGNATFKQTLAAARILKQDVENRRTSYDDQIKGIKARIGKATAAPETSGTIYARDPQGKVHSAKAGTALPAGWVQVERQ